MDNIEKQTRTVVAIRDKRLFDLISGLALVAVAAVAAVFSAVKENWIMLAADIVLAILGGVQLVLYAVAMKQPKELVVLENGEISYYNESTKSMESVGIEQLKAVDVAGDGSRRGQRAVLVLFFKWGKVEVRNISNIYDAAVALRKILYSPRETEVSENE